MWNTNGELHGGIPYRKCNAQTLFYDGFDFLGPWSKSREFMSPASIHNKGVHGYEQGCTLHGFPVCVGISQARKFQLVLQVTLKLYICIYLQHAC